MGDTLVVVPVRNKSQSERTSVDDPALMLDSTSLHDFIPDEDDGLSADERAALHAQLEASWRSAQEGRVRPASELLAELRARRG